MNARAVRGVGCDDTRTTLEWVMMKHARLVRTVSCVVVLVSFLLVVLLRVPWPCAFLLAVLRLAVTAVPD